jgi:tight adherence protein C
MNQILLLAVLLFATLALAIFGVANAAAYRRRRRQVVDKIRGVKPVAAGPGFEQAPAGPWHTRSLLALASAIGLRFAGEQPGGSPSHQRQLFLQAGFRGARTMTAFLGFKVLGGLLLGAGGVLWRVLAPSAASPLVPVLAVVACALAGWYLPDIVLHLRIAHRKELLLQGFPDALDLMVVCVESGMGLDAAVTRVGEEIRLSSPVVSEEFRLLSLELRAGKMRRDALHALALRTGLEEFSGFASLLTQTDRFGTSVSQALRVHADAVRVRRALRAEELAAKLPVKLVFPLILFIFPSIFVVILGPAAIKIYRSLLQVLH